jgi:hypothetical protein
MPRSSKFTLVIKIISQVYRLGASHPVYAKILALLKQNSK